MSDPHPPLQLSSTIDAAEFARLAIEVKAALLQQNLAERERMMRASDTISTKFISRDKADTIAIWLCVTGLVLALAMSALGGIPYRGYRLDWAFAAFFALILVLLPVLRRFGAWVRKPWLPCWEFFATMNTNMLLKAVRANVPFEAEYVFEGDTVSCFRTRQGQRNLAWSRPLHGVCLSGPGFTLFYKKAKSMAPYAAILHQPSAEFDALLGRLGLQRLGPHVATDFHHDHGKTGNR